MEVSLYKKGVNIKNIYKLFGIIIISPIVQEVTGGKAKLNLSFLLAAAAGASWRSERII